MLTACAVAPDQTDRAAASVAPTTRADASCMPSKTGSSSVPSPNQTAGTRARPHMPHHRDVLRVVHRLDLAVGRGRRLDHGHRASGEHPEFAGKLYREPDPHRVERMPRPEVVPCKGVIPHNRCRPSHHRCPPSVLRTLFFLQALVRLILGRRAGRKGSSPPHALAEDGRPVGAFGPAGMPLVAAELAAAVAGRLDRREERGADPVLLQLPDRRDRGARRARSPPRAGSPGARPSRAASWPRRRRPG